jgi:hypothetical protein
VRSSSLSAFINKQIKREDHSNCAGLKILLGEQHFVLAMSAFNLLTEFIWFRQDAELLRVDANSKLRATARKRA